MTTETGGGKEETSEDVESETVGGKVEKQRETFEDAEEDEKSEDVENPGRRELRASGPPPEDAPYFPVPKSSLNFYPSRLNFYFLTVVSCVRS